jgi:hypothetical protein
MTCRQKIYGYEYIIILDSGRWFWCEDVVNGKVEFKKTSKNSLVPINHKLCPNGFKTKIEI